MTDLNNWQLQLAAWTHDPAEKPLVLLRDPAGHEGGTVAQLQQTLFANGIEKAQRDLVKRADQWASAADRPNYPRDNSGRYQQWAQVNFAEQPQLIHPLSGQSYDLDKLSDIVRVAQIKAVSTDHFDRLIHRDQQGSIDYKATALAFWRFGPELSSEGLAALWKLLPADTRVPDHTIWNHLDLTSAFACAMAGSDNGQPALLAMSFGPVQDFIAQARSTSDLWAGSHLLSRMVWEGLSVICDDLGPQSVLFPQLRDIALVDTWLLDQGVDREHFKDCDWLQSTTDKNPLFAAALTNKFTALVPASRAEELAKKVTAHVRAWVQEQGLQMLETLLQQAGTRCDKNLYCYQQLQDQLSDFPEVHWASVSWELVEQKDGKASAGQLQLKEVLASFAPEGKNFLDSDKWKLLQKNIELDGVSFFTPNPGVLYPDLYNLLDRLLAAAKTSRPFKPLPQEGWRCTLTGDYEWLTTDRELLTKARPARQKDTSGKRQEDTSGKRQEDSLWLWKELVGKFGIKEGEHLCAIAMLKRLWPSHFCDWVSELTGQKIDRFVVSTHALAMSGSLRHLTDKHLPPHALAPRFTDEKAQSVALPRKLMRQLHNQPREILNIARILPWLMDEAKQQGDVDLQNNIECYLNQSLGTKPETYYALLYLDGDHMGAWLADSWPDNEEGNSHRLRFKDTWHKKIRAGITQRFDRELLQYPEHYRPLSPARHMAISGALNSFALHIARYVVEECYMGRLIYAGGDDVMAMVAVHDLLPCMLSLRLAYSGIDIDDEYGLLNLERLRLGGGHALLNNRLYRLMGSVATASLGAVVAHHTAPLARVLRELRQAEADAKANGRDSFAMRIIKRSGGAEHLAMGWLSCGQSWRQTLEIGDTNLGQILRLSRYLSGKAELSRRVAYLIKTWLQQLPAEPAGKGREEYTDMLHNLLQYQLSRQTGDKPLAKNIAGDLRLIMESAPDGKITENLAQSFAVAEFFAREGRQ